MNRDPEIEALLNAARVAAITELEGLPATRDLLELAGARCRDHVLVQADLGLWRKWSITTSAELAPMACRFELAPPSLVQTHPIRVVWDFKHTPLWFLETH